MEILWSPWRHEYISKAGQDNSQDACIFCEAQQNPARDPETFILHRGTHNFVILNKYPYTNGHLLVLVGFDPKGNPIVNDPAFPSNEEVQSTYVRAEFEPLWLQTSGGTVYLIYPAGHSFPAIQ